MEAPRRAWLWLVAFCALLSLQALLLFFAPGASVSEPFRDVLEVAVNLARIVFTLLAMLSPALVLLAFGLARVRAIAQAGLALTVASLWFLPLTVAVAAGAGVVSLRPPNIEFYGPGGKPPWINHAAFDVLGAPATFLVLIAAFVGVCATLVWREHVRELEAGPRCEHCGYSTRGLRQNVCPECGAGISASAR